MCARGTPKRHPPNYCASPQWHVLIELFGPRLWRFGGSRRHRPLMLNGAGPVEREWMRKPLIVTAQSAVQRDRNVPM